LKRDTILFDLDGTLLPVELDEFLEHYFHSLTEELSDLFEKEVLIEAIMKATNDMIDNDGSKLNCEVFKDSFFRLVRVDNQEEVMARFDRFYKTKFTLIKELINGNEIPARVVNYLKERNYRLIVATNPLFPLIAIMERISWSNLDPDDFSFITAYENMHYCKPSLNYYREIMGKCNLEPEQCFMIGNDTKEDMIAGQLGIKTLLVTDHLIDRGPDDRYESDWSGKLQELIGFFENKGR